MAYQLRQGYVRQGQGEERVTTPARFAHKLNQYVTLYQPVCFGTITVEPNAIYQYGYLQNIHVDEKKAQWTFVFLHAETDDEVRISVPLLGISLTHDIEFTIDDEQKGDVTYPVFYMNVAEKPREPSVTYYIGARDLVSNPLACIAEFYMRTHEIGKNLKLPEQSACNLTPPSPFS